MWAFLMKKQDTGIPARLRDAVARALDTAALAQQMIAEARSIDQLDIGRAELQKAFAELRLIIRQAKAMAGQHLLPVEVTEEAHRRLVEQMTGGPPITAAERQRWFAA